MAISNLVMHYCTTGNLSLWYLWSIDDNAENFYIKDNFKKIIVKTKNDENDWNNRTDKNDKNKKDDKIVDNNIDKDKLLNHVIND